MLEIKMRVLTEITQTQKLKSGDKDYNRYQLYIPQVFGEKVKQRNKKGQLVLYMVVLNKICVLATDEQSLLATMSLFEDIFNNQSKEG